MPHVFGRYSNRGILTWWNDCHHAREYLNVVLVLCEDVECWRHILQICSQKDAQAYDDSCTLALNPESPQDGPESARLHGEVKVFEQTLRKTEDSNRRWERIAFILERIKRFLIVVDWCQVSFGEAQDGRMVANNDMRMAYYGMMVVECAYEAELLSIEDVGNR